LKFLPLTLYAAAVVVYAIHFAKRQVSVGRAATTLLLLGVLAHTFVIGMQTMEVRHVPFSNTSTAVSSFVWMLALSYLYLEVTTDERAMGVFIVPILVGLQTIPAINPGIDIRDPVLDSPWFWVHVTSLLFAYATFALAAMLGLTYVLQFKEIKKKHLGYFYERLPSLHVLDAMNSRAVAVGWLFLTIGVVV
jgi:ABC-type transport system involved in cytochrome c biogenesis permease subunit